MRYLEYRAHNHFAEKRYEFDVLREFIYIYELEGDFRERLKGLEKTMYESDLVIMFESLEPSKCSPRDYAVRRPELLEKLTKARMAGIDVSFYERKIRELEALRFKEFVAFSEGHDETAKKYDDPKRYPPEIHEMVLWSAKRRDAINDSK